MARVFREYNYFGIGSMTIASSGNDASPALPLMLVLDFQLFRACPGTGRPPKLLRYNWVTAR